MRVLKWSLLTVAILTVIISLTLNRKSSIDEPKNRNEYASTIFRVDSAQIKDIIWEGDHLLIMNENQIIRISFPSRDQTVIEEGNYKDTILGEYDSGIVLCNYVNKDISSPDEKATVIAIRSLNGDLIQEIEFFETVRIDQCMEDEMIFSNNFYGATEQYYKLNRDAGLEPLKIYSPNLVISGSSMTKVDLKGAKLFEIDKVNVFNKVALNSGLTKAAFIDVREEVWVYERY
jgi:hypothetical protein